MTTYTAIPNTSIDIDSPVTQPLLTALRDNPIAITEGSSGAPRISTAAFGSTYYTQGGIGTYCFASGPTTAFGSTTAGSNLNPISAMYTASDMGEQFGTGLGPTTGSALSGTWRAMGQAQASWTIDANGPNPATTASGATLWLRIS